jgi:crotonobetainyl-CoA:carnitine CoA-transferase CaiB-like acyl-CoA transferase
MDFQAAAYLVEGKVPVQAGNEHPYSTPMGVLQTKDGYINIGVGGEGQWASFCQVLGKPDLAGQPDYADNGKRLQNRAKLMAELGAVFKTRTSVEWLNVLEAASVPAGPIYHVDEVFSDPQVQHLGIASPITHPELGPIRLVGQPVELSRTPAAVLTPTPDRGAHTDEILGEIGIGALRVAELRASQVI